LLDELLDFLPSEVDPTQVRAVVLLPRAFDRVTGQLAFLVRPDRPQVVLSRPLDFELFREIPLAAKAPVTVVRVGGAAHVKVRVIDGKVLMLALEPHEAERLDALLAATKRRSSRPSSRGSSVRAPESVEAEVVVVRNGLIKPITPVPERASSVPSTLEPSPEALAQVSGEHVVESSKYDSVRPPPMAPEANPSLFAEPVEAGPRDLPTLRARLRRHWDLGQLDEACQVARVVAFLGPVEPMEKRLASLDAGSASPRPVAPHLFQAYVAHADEDPDLSRLFVALWPALLTMRLRPERDMGLRARDAVDVLTAERGFAGIFRQASRALSIPTPRLWIRADVPGGLAHLNVSPVGSLCGGSLAQGFSELETLFVAAHHLAFYRPEVYLLALLPSQGDLLTLACAGLHLERRVPPDPRIAKVAESIERFMVPQVRESLRAACAELSLPGDPRTFLAAELLRFRRAATFSAARAGFLVSGSVPVAARMIRLLPSSPGLEADEVLDDVLAFAVSPAFFALRRELGIALAPSSPGAD